MNVKTTLWALITVVLGAALLRSEGMDFLHPRNYSYTLRVSRTASYQLMPGDYVRVEVTSGPDEDRTSLTVLKKVQVIDIADHLHKGIYLRLSLNQGEAQSLREALSKPHSTLALRVVQKQPRPEIASPANDGVEALDLDEKTDVVQTSK